MDKYIKINRFEFVMIIIQRIVSSAALTFVPIYVGWVLDKGILAIKNNSNPDFSQFILFGLIIIVVILLSSYLSVKYEVIFIKKIRNKLETEAFSSIIASETSQTKDRNIMINEIDLLVGNYFKNILVWPTLIVPLCIGLCYTLFVSYISMIVMIIGLLIVMVINQILVKPLSNSMHNLQLSKARTNKTLLGFLNSLTTLNVFQKVEYAKNRISNELKSKLETERKVKKIEVIIEAINNFFSILIQLIPIIVLAIMVYRNEISTGEALSIILLFEKIVAPIEGIGNLRASIGSVNIIKKENEVLLATNTVDESARSSHDVECCSIEFKEVSYKYDEKYVFKSLSFMINNNQKCLLKGNSGSGKSTILKILTKQIVDYEGDVFIGSRNLREMSKTELYNIIGILPQKPEMIAGTIAENISFGDQDKESVLNCLNEARLPLSSRQLDESINEVNLYSGGELQRIALARIFYHNKKILLLDEITSSLDKQSAMEIEEVILGIDNKLVLNVAHMTANHLREKYDKVIQLST